MKARYASGAPSHEFVGLGVVLSNEWFEVSDEQAAEFKKAHDMTLAQAGFEVKENKKKKEAD